MTYRIEVRTIDRPSLRQPWPLLWVRADFVPNRNATLTVHGHTLSILSNPAVAEGLPTSMLVVGGWPTDLDLYSLNNARGELTYAEHDH